MLSALFNLSHYWLLLLFLVALVIAAYLAWRDEYAKSVTERMIGRITSLEFIPFGKQCLIVVNVRIRNLGPQTAAHEWNGRYTDAQGANTYLSSNAFNEDEKIEGKSGNLVLDEKIIEQGGIRSGWLAFHVSRQDAQRIMQGRLDQNLDLSFADTFGNRYQVTMFDK